MNLLSIITAPVITEKATMLEKKGKYVLVVKKEATKIDVKQAFKKLYGVDAVKVNVMRTSEKTATRGKRKAVVKRHEYKKVIVTTKAKKAVDLTKLKLK